MKKVNIAIDVESGDFGPRVMIGGVLDALQRNGGSFKALLCGSRSKIERVLARDRGRWEQLSSSIEIVHCTETVHPGETARSRIWRTRKDSPAIRCISLQKEGFADASVSAGDTAILMSAALFILGRRKSALRPVLAATMPTIRKKPVLVLDVGANLNCRTEHLVSFAEMGLEYVRVFFGSKSPSIALLNVGSESVKGTGVIGETEKVLSRKFRSFSGYIEGNQILAGDADIVVCDGFTGNVLLKVCESFHYVLRSVLGKDKKLSDGALPEIDILNAENYGAVPFLGIKGLVFKAHGGSSQRAIASAVLSAERVVRKTANRRIFE